MGLLSTLVLSSALTIFGGEVREASQKAHIPTPPVVFSATLPDNPAWILWPCPEGLDCSGFSPALPPVPTVYLNPAHAKGANEWMLTLWAYHEVCHVKLGHHWPAGTTQEQMDRDHREVRDCQIDLLGKARYFVLRRIIYGNTHSSVPVRHNAPVFGGRQW
jgi:hypothetical protein